jgi:DNA-binding transcriptional MerR regulator
MKQLISIKQAAKEFGIGEHRIRRWAKVDPTFPVVQIGAHKC